MGWLAAIGSFLGQILKAILPDLFKEARKPREVENVGMDEGLVKDIDSSIEDSIDSDPDPTENPMFPNGMFEEDD